MMDIHQILKQLPHRYPILLVDRVLEIEKGVRIKAIKNVSINEPFFMGHFPHRPVMPGVLMLEALAQAAALLSQTLPQAEVLNQSILDFEPTRTWDLALIKGVLIHINPDALPAEERRRRRPPAHRSRGPRADERAPAAPGAQRRRRGSRHAHPATRCC